MVQKENEIKKLKSEMFYSEEKRKKMKNELESSFC